MRFALPLCMTVLVFLSLPNLGRCQRLELQTQGRNASLRGLSVVTDLVAWVSGSNGTVARTVDGGKNWVWMTVSGHAEKDFRDIEAFDERRALIMCVGEPGLILLTEDGGDNWKTVYTDSSKGVFLDAMDFLPDGSGVVVGDPLDGRLYLAETNDGGRSWSLSPTVERPTIDSAEAFFAASGTNVRLLPGGGRVAVTGGRRSRLLKDRVLHDLGMLQGKQTTGANSVAFSGKGLNMVIVGGDFAIDTLRTGNCLVSADGGTTWTQPRIPPFGYRSSVEWIAGRRWVSCGTSGVDISTDEGETWENLGREGFHVCRRAKDGKSVFLAGGRGRIARLHWE